MLYVQILFLSFPYIVLPFRLNWFYLMLIEMVILLGIACALLSRSNKNQLATAALDFRPDSLYFEDSKKPISTTFLLFSFVVCSVVVAFCTLPTMCDKIGLENWACTSTRATRATKATLATLATTNCYGNVEGFGKEQM